MEVIYDRVAGLDVHKKTVVACVRTMKGGKITRECRTFETTTASLLALLAWLTESGCTHVAMEATGVYWVPVWGVLNLTLQSAPEPGTLAAFGVAIVSLVAVGFARRR